MDSIIQQITSLIGTLGFPIVSCWFLWKFINSTLQDFTKSLNAHTELLVQIKEMLNRKGGDNL